MTPRGGAGRGQGRKQKLGTKKHTIRIKDTDWLMLLEIGTYTNKKGKVIQDASRGLEIVISERKEQQDKREEEG